MDRLLAQNFGAVLDVIVIWAGELIFEKCSRKLGNACILTMGHVTFFQDTFFLRSAANWEGPGPTWAHGSHGSHGSHGAQGGGGNWSLVAAMEETDCKKPSYAWGWSTRGLVLVAAMEETDYTDPSYPYIYIYI